MNLKTYLKWRLNDLLALRKLPEGSEAHRRRFRALCADAMPVCAAELKAAKPGSDLYPAGRSRKLWTTLGYVAIVLFLITVAAFVLSYWLISDHRAAWLTSKALFVELALVAVEVVLMLLCANRVTAIQNAHVRRCADAIVSAYDALPGAEAECIARTLRQPAVPENPEQRCGCCACGALFVPDRASEGALPDEKCPRCGAEFQLVFEAPEAPLDEDKLNRLRSFLGA